MILLLYHDRRSLADVASLKGALEDCYGPFGLKVQEKGYLYVPFKGPQLNAARLLKHFCRASDALGTKKALWLVDRELFYPEIGRVLGCSAENEALLYAGLEPEALAKEGLHEVGHLMGLEHCRQSCVMHLSDSPSKARQKPSLLCQECSARLRAFSDDGVFKLRE
ncbi:Archaemetzincin [uncultured archaeon]|nr:Archaemetzincin [uncultured archaeon]